MLFTSILTSNCARYSPPPKKGSKEYLDERRLVKKMINEANNRNKTKRTKK